VRLGAGVRVGHFAQAQAGLDWEKTVLDTILDTGLSSVSQARDFLGQYHLSGDNAFKRVGDLSGGEQARVALALLALERANFLLLDEPTNHLDILSQEVLQEVLTSFQGTVLLVAHDRYLIRALATRVWAIAGGELHAFDQGYDAYRAWTQQQRAGGPATTRERQEAESRKESARLERGAEKEEKRRIERLERQRAEVEGIIHQLEARLATLEVALAQASSAQQVDRVVKLGTEHRTLQAELDAQLALWETLA
jgi:ATP-binding cassette subfamily F protein 3